MNAVYKEFVVLVIGTFAVVGSATAILPELHARMISVICTAILSIGCGLIIYNDTKPKPVGAV